MGLQSAAFMHCNRFVHLIITWTRLVERAFWATTAAAHSGPKITELCLKRPYWIFFFFLFFVGWIEWSSRIFSMLIKVLRRIHYLSPLTPFSVPKRGLTTVRWNLCCTRYAFSAFSGEFCWAWLILSLRAGKINHECSPRNFNTAQLKATTCCELKDTFLELHFANSSDLKLISWRHWKIKEKSLRCCLPRKIFRLRQVASVWFWGRSADCGGVLCLLTKINKILGNTDRK